MLLSILIFSFGILLYVMMEMDRKGRGELGKLHAQTQTKPSYMVHDLPSELPLIYIFDIFYWKNHLCLLPDRY